jgi:hypothetical protein
MLHHSFASKLNCRAIEAMVWAACSAHVLLCATHEFEQLHCAWGQTRWSPTGMQKCHSQGTPHFHAFRGKPCLAHGRRARVARHLDRRLQLLPAGGVRLLLMRGHVGPTKGQPKCMPCN